MMRMAARLATVADAQQFVRFTTTGWTFSPSVELVGGSSATVRWKVEETGVTATGINPTIDFGSVGTRHVRMTVTGGAGLADIVTLNLGYNHAFDESIYSPAASYDYTAQPISAITGLTLLRNLVLFMADSTGLSGAVSFRGLSSLTNIECYQVGAPRGIGSIDITGCTALLRLVVEGSDLTTLDLNPVTACLRDIRAAVQRGGSLTFATLTSNLAVLFHWCVRDQTVVNSPTAAQMPVVQQRWIWNTAYTGALTSASSTINSLLAYSNAAMTSVDVTNQFPAGRGAVMWLQNCTSLSSVTLTGCNGLGNANFSGCTSLNQSAVDGILSTVDSWATSSGTLNLGSTTAPSAAGVINYLNLVGRNWTVTTTSGGTGVFADNFDRANTTGGLSEVGNGWHSINGAVANIVSNALENQSTLGTYRTITNPAQGLLPADYSVTITVPHWVLVYHTWWGLVARYNPADGTGVRLIFTANSTTLTIGNASGPFTGNVSQTTDSGFPASWSVDQNHTVRLKVSGSTATLFCDGQQVLHGTITVNQAMTGSEYGFCGDNNATFYGIAASRQ